MTARQANGTLLTKSALEALTTTVTQPTIRKFNETVYETFEQPGEKVNESGRRILFAAGQEVPQAQIDALYPSGTFTSISPATGAAAGGTNVTIKGTNLSGATAVSIGGVATTNFLVVDDQTITCTTGAHAAGAVNVVITDDAGTITGTNAYTYV